MIWEWIENGTKIKENIEDKRRKVRKGRRKERKGDEKRGEEERGEVDMRLGSEIEWMSLG